jgi:O-antigen/teichoic acid export membrane protein
VSRYEPAAVIDCNRSQGHVTKDDVAKGSALSFLARAGAIVELVAQPIYTRLFGVATYGLYMVLWSAVSLLSTIFDLGQTAALPRVIPQARTETQALALLKAGLITALLGSSLAALAVCLSAQWIAGLLNAADQDIASLPLAIQLFAWAIPLWTFIEVVGAAVRARRAFGQEARIKIVYEQCIRLAAALAAFLLGWSSLGLISAHLLSLAFACLLSINMLGCHYDLRRLLSVKITPEDWRLCLSCGLALMPANLIKRSFSDLPVVILNILLPGAAGAKAAALYAIARKVSSVLQLVQMSFSYVMAPLASAHAAAVDVRAVGPLYAYSTRLATIVLLPMAAGMLCIGVPLLSVFSPEAALAYPVLVVLLVGRALEATAGPGGAILDVLGRPSQPLMNALAGLLVMAVLAYWLVPALGALGMAIGVSLGLLFIGLLGQFQLLRCYHIHPYDLGFIRAFISALLSGFLLYALYWVSQQSMPWGSTAVVLVGVFPALWLSARFGLNQHDREALGQAGRIARLV